MPIVDNVKPMRDGPLVRYSKHLKQLQLQRMANFKLKQHPETGQWYVYTYLTGSDSNGRELKWLWFPIDESEKAFYINSCKTPIISWESQ